MITVALKEAHKSSCRTRHGAIVAKNGRVLGRGHNSYRSHGGQWGGGPLKTLHAEAAAMRDATHRGIDVRGCTLYVTRGDTNRISKPCPSCQALLERYGISKVVYTDEEGNVLTEWPLATDILPGMSGRLSVAIRTQKTEIF